MNFKQLDLSQKLAFAGNALLIAGGVLLSASALVRACSTGNISDKYQYRPNFGGMDPATTRTTNYFEL